MCAEEVGRQLDRAGHLAKGVSPQPDPGEPGFQIALPSPGNRPAFHPDSSRVPLSRHLLGDTVITVVLQWNILPKVVEGIPLLSPAV